MCKSFWRKKVVSIEEMEIPYESPEQGELMKAVMRLPGDYKEVVYLHYYEGRPIPEIAGLMQKNTNTVYTILRRARERLKKSAADFI